MSVKRYDPELEKDGGLGVPSLTMYAKHTGSWVEYKDYAALEETLAQRDAQIAALTAENVAQRRAFEMAREEMRHHSDDAGLFSYDADGEQMDALLRLCDAQAAIDEALSPTNTPATNAAANALRAEGVEWFATALAHEVMKSGEDYDSWKSTASNAAMEYAEQLREGK